MYRSMSLRVRRHKIKSISLALMVIGQVVEPMLRHISRKKKRRLTMIQEVMTVMQVIGETLLSWSQPTVDAPRVFKGKPITSDMLSTICDHDIATRVARYHNEAAKLAVEITNFRKVSKTVDKDLGPRRYPSQRSLVAYKSTQGTCQISG